MTSTSPFGNTWSKRGLSNPSANRLTSKPAGADGIFPLGQATKRDGLATPRVAYGGGKTSCSAGPASTTAAPAGHGNKIDSATAPNNAAVQAILRMRTNIAWFLLWRN